MISRICLAIALATALAVLSAPPPVFAKDLRIGIQPGITYLPLLIIEQQHLLEKHAGSLGITDLTVTWRDFAGGGAMNDGLISGSLDVACSGTPAFLPLWDKTRGSLKVQGIAAYTGAPLVLLTNNPNIKTIKDFTDRDRIALPAVRASSQALILEMAAAKTWGPKNFNRLDHLTVSRAHPDALAALLSRHGDITAHFSGPPFIEIELRDPHIHKILTASDVFGGPFTVGMCYATDRLREQNPKLIEAFVAALKEAMALLHSDHVAAAKIYLSARKSPLSVDEVKALLDEPSMTYSVVPQNVAELAHFMNRHGMLKHDPTSWKDLFFPEIQDQPGS